MLSLLRKELSAQRGTIIGWVIGLAAYIILVLALYPSLADQLKAMQLPEFYKFFGESLDLGSVEGYLAIEAYDLIIPLAVGILAVVLGTGALAGEEEKGTLETLLSMPLARWQIVTMKAVAIAVVLLVTCLSIFASSYVGVLWIQNQIDASIAPLRLLQTSLAGWALAMFFGMLGLFLGAYLPGRRHASALSSAIVAASYLLNSLGNIVDKIKPLQPWLPTHYFDSKDIMTNGLATKDMAILLGFAALFFLLALLSFQRRNVTVEAWPWQRPRVQIQLEERRSSQT